MIWKPNITVASIVELDGKFLMVEEHSPSGPVLNQPAGHLEPKETIEAAVVRETLEETGYTFTPGFMVGSYLWYNEANDATYFRTTFSGSVCEKHIAEELDDGIIRALWMTHEEILQNEHRLRGPMVLESLNDYLNGKKHPLDIVKSFIE